MAIEQVPEKVFGRINNSLRSGDFSLVLDLFVPTAVFENTMRGSIKLNGPELITDWFNGLGRGCEFVISKPAVAENFVAVNFDLYRSSSDVVRGMATIEVGLRDKVKAIFIENRVN